MSKTTQLSVLAAAAVVGFGLSLTTTTAQASTFSMLDKCHGSSRAISENCCSAWVKRNGRMVYVTEISSSCRGPFLVGSNKNPDPPPPPPPPPVRIPPPTIK
jgi:hypothetical protein